MKQNICYQENLSRLIAAVVVGAFFLSGATAYAQNHCGAKANYEAAKQAAEMAQRDYNKYRLPGHVEKLLVKDPTDRAEKLPEQKMEDGIVYTKTLVKKLQGQLSQARTKEDRDRLKERIVEFSQMIREAEMWLQARKMRDAVERKLELSKAAYMNAITAKDAALKNARAIFAQEQANIQRVRASLDGRPQDAAYVRDVTVLLTRTRASYERLLIYLSLYDCFADVRGFMDDLKQRMKKIDTNMTIVRNASSTPARPSAPVSPPAPVPAPPSGASASNISGTWKYAGDRGTAVITQSGNLVRMRLTLKDRSDAGQASPHYEITATLSGGKLDGMWGFNVEPSSSKRTYPLDARFIQSGKNCKSGTFQAMIGQNTISVSSATQDECGHGWVGVVFTRR